MAFKYFEEASSWACYIKTATVMKNQDI